MWIHRILFMIMILKHFLSIVVASLKISQKTRVSKQTFDVSSIKRQNVSDVESGFFCVFFLHNTVF